MDTFAKRLTLLRQLKGWNKQEFAEKLGMSKSNMTHYENGRHKPEIDTAVKMKKLLGCTYEFLLEGILVEPNQPEANGDKRGM